MRRVTIPKSDGGERELGIPTVTDRLVQQAILQVLGPRYDATFSPHSHGFRPNHSAHHAVMEAQRYIQEGYDWLVDVDLNGVVFDREKGTPQGGPLSPLLANVLIDDIDKLLEARGHRFVRYADDCNIYVQSRRAGERVMTALRKDKRLAEFLLAQSLCEMKYYAAAITVFNMILQALLLGLVPLMRRRRR